MKTLLLSFFLLSSCSSIIEKEYETLKDQQFNALAGNDKSFNQLQKDFIEIKPKLLIELKKYRHHFSKTEFKEIITTLKNSDPKNNIEQLVFHRFHGNWRGTWRQSEKVSHYDHTWYPPKKNKDIIFQKVFIGEWDGKNRQNEIAAINSYSTQTGLILGAVDINKTKTATVSPHLGFYINPSTLIWFARFKESFTPYYSLYYEKVKGEKNNLYTIRGIGFHYKKKILNSHWKTGLYQKVLK